ncbi:MAG: hypothetical protein ACOY5U_06815 [Pseudomonadota bacterium]
MRAAARMAILALAAGLSGCAEAGPAPEAAAFRPAQFQGVEVWRLDNELINFLVAMKGPGAADGVAEYARCAAAGYTVARGYGFARHVRTKVYEEGGVWRADAVYTISPALPKGIRTIDAEVTVADCLERGIPTV